MITRKPILLFFFLAFVFTLQGQEEDKKTIRKGNNSYEKEEYSDAEVAYRKAIEKNEQSSIANYNLGNTLYRMGRDKEALDYYQKGEEFTNDKKLKAKTFHNAGNTFMKNKQYDQAVASYKQALKNNPKDDETRYNYALAKKRLQKRQNQQNNKDKNKDKDKKNDNKKDKNKGENNKEKEEKKEEGGQKDKNDDGNEKNNKDKEKDKREGKKKNQKQAPKLSKDDIGRLLKALEQEEKKSQKKVKEKETKAVIVKREKDW